MQIVEKGREKNTPERAVSKVDFGFACVTGFKILNGKFSTWELGAEDEVTPFETEFGCRGESGETPHLGMQSITRMGVQDEINTKGGVSRQGMLHLSEILLSNLKFKQIGPRICHFAQNLPGLHVFTLQVAQFPSQDDSTHWRGDFGAVQTVGEKFDVLFLSQSVEFSHLAFCIIGSGLGVCLLDRPPLARLLCPCQLGTQVSIIQAGQNLTIGNGVALADEHLEKFPVGSRHRGKAVCRQDGAIGRDFVGPRDAEDEQQ